jgi:transposase
MDGNQELLQQIEELLLAHPQGLRQAEIARMLGVHRSTISRFLPKLEEERVLLWENGNGYLGIVNQDVLPKRVAQLDEPLRRLINLLEKQENEETKYQELFQSYPWTLGAQYERIERHQKLDDQNIPDFTGIRVWDHCRDIFEIKPPFMPVFRSDGEFTSNFNESWNQAERYLDFARLERDYLRRKGLDFDNPRCILILGFNLPEELARKIRAKQRLNPSIQVLTYDEVLAFTKHTIKFVRKLKSDDEVI